MERPLRLEVDLSPDRRQHFHTICREAKEEPLANVIDRVETVLGAGPHTDFNLFMEAVSADAIDRGVKMTAKRKNLLQSSAGIPPCGRCAGHQEGPTSRARRNRTQSMG